MISENIITRATNCLCGGIVGDAFGGRYEFKGSLFKVDSEAYKDKRLPILGGGVWDLEAGQVTDDSELAMALAESIVRAKCVDTTAIAQTYREWYKSHPFDIGKATKNALRYATPEAIMESAKDYDEECIKSFGDPNLSNGMLMRIAPIAVTMAGMYQDDNSDADFCSLVRIAVQKDTVLTHASREAVCYASAYTLLLSYAILDGNLKRGIKMVHHEYKKYQGIGDWYQVFCSGISPNGRLAHAPTENIGDVRIAFQLAVRKGLMVSFRTMTFEEAMVSTVSLGGDTDTNACIVGYLCGAMTGLGATEIPGDWKKTCIECNTDRYLQHAPNQYIRDIRGLATKLLTIGRATYSRTD